MIKQLVIIAFIFIQMISFGHTKDSLDVFLLKKGENLEMKDCMAEYSSSGFYLYRNCFYDIQLHDKSIHSLKLIDIKPDSLVFHDIADFQYNELNPSHSDTLIIHFMEIKKILLMKDWDSKKTKKIWCSDYHFLFHKSSDIKIFESKYKKVLSRDELTELVPRLGAKGITYHFEYNGELYNYPDIEVITPKYSNEEQLKAFRAIENALFLLFNEEFYFNKH